MYCPLVDPGLYSSYLDKSEVNMFQLGLEGPHFSVRVTSRPRLIALLVLGLSGCLFAQSWTEKLWTGFDTAVSASVNPSPLVGLGTFTYKYDDLSTPFSRWLEDQLRTSAGQTKHIRICDKQAAAAMDPAFKKAYGALFENANVDALLYGRFFDEAQGLRIYFSLTDLSTSALICSSEILLPYSSIPGNLSLRPETQSASIKAELQTIAPSPPSPISLPLQVSVSTDRGSGAAYKAGESLEVLVTVNKKAWVKVYQIDVAGKVQLIWPNRFSGAIAPLEAGSVVCFPGSDPRYAFVLGAPFGTEFIKVVASTEPFASTEADFSNLTGGAKESIARGSQSVSAEAERAEGLASYIILEK